MSSSLRSAAGEERGVVDRDAGHLADGDELAVAAVREDLAVHLLQVVVDRSGPSRSAAEPGSSDAGSFAMKLMTSIRNPSTPRSSQRFIIA